MSQLKGSLVDEVVFLVVYLRPGTDVVCDANVTSHYSQNGVVVMGYNGVLRTHAEARCHAVIQAMRDGFTVTCVQGMHENKLVMSKVL